MTSLSVMIDFCSTFLIRNSRWAAMSIILGLIVTGVIPYAARLPFRQARLGRKI